MKCSIITIHHIHNFGSVFQAYGLYKFLDDNGINAEIIDYRPAYYDQGKKKLRTFVGKCLNIKAYTTRKKKFENFLKTHDRFSDKQFRSTSELETFYGKDTSLFIAGGDQLWNNYHPCGRDDAYKLTFAKKGIKLAYGTSMGRDNFNDEELKELASKTDDFKKIMLREKSTVDMLGKFSKTEVNHVIDPVGLIDVEEFKKIAKKPDIDEPYAVMYLADSSEILDASVEYLSKKLGLKIVHICGFKQKCYCDRFEKSAGPEEILGYILYSEFVLSASFHATMFSLMFNKQFATLLPGVKTNARIEDLLKGVNLENRIIHSKNDIAEIENKIDFTHANAVLDELKQKSCIALLESIGEMDKENV